MTSIPALPGGNQRKAGALLVAALVVAGLLWAYWPALVALRRWWAQDPQYTHAYVVPLFALIVLYFRRDSFPAHTRPAWWGLALVLAGAVMRMLGGVFLIQALDAGSLVPVAVGLVVLAGGASLLRWCWPALTFLLFVLPVPDQADTLLGRPLRRLATVTSTYALQTLGVPALAEGNVIVVNELKVGVVEACSGLGMLMTFFALATAVAFVVRRPLPERLAVFASAVPIGVLMNVVRITVTVLCFQLASAEVARVVFHDVAGWVMMPLALGVLWLELQFLERLWLPLAGPKPVPVLPSPGPSSPTSFPMPALRALEPPARQPERRNAEWAEEPAEAPLPSPVPSRGEE